MPSWARTLVLVATLVVVWLAPRAAFAAAPLCDDRGAIMLAPPPTLDPPAASIDLGTTGDGCFDMSALSTGCDQGSHPEPTPAPMHVDTLVPSMHIALAGPGVSLVSPDPTERVRRPGVRVRLERPPRG